MGTLARCLCATLALLAAGCSLRQQPPPGASGAEIYRLQNCANCHGPSGEGTGRGPALDGLAAHWTQADLALFLADPKSRVASDQRLGRLQELFGSSEMGPYDNLDGELRATLAAWLLALDERP